MRNLIVILMSLAMSCVASATKQVPDILRYKGLDYHIGVNPLEFCDAIKGIKFLPDGSGNSRGYQATWEIRNHRLYLIAIDGLIVKPDGSKKRANLAEIFRDQLQKGRVYADWFTGTIFFPSARYGLTFPEEMRKKQLNDADLILRVVKGRVVVLRDQTPNKAHTNPLPASNRKPDDNENPQP